MFYIYPITLTISNTNLSILYNPLRLYITVKAPKPCQSINQICFWVCDYDQDSAIYSWIQVIRCNCQSFCQPPVIPCNPTNLNKVVAGSCYEPGFFMEFLPIQLTNHLRNPVFFRKPKLTYYQIRLDISTPILNKDEPGSIRPFILIIPFNRYRLDIYNIYLQTEILDQHLLITREPIKFSPITLQSNLFISNNFEQFSLSTTLNDLELASHPSPIPFPIGKIDLRIPPVTFFLQYNRIAQFDAAFSSISIHPLQFLINPAILYSELLNIISSLVDLYKTNILNYSYIENTISLSNYEFLKQTIFRINTSQLTINLLNISLLISPALLFGSNSLSIDLTSDLSKHSRFEIEAPQLSIELSEIEFRRQYIYEVEPIILSISEIRSEIYRSKTLIYDPININLTSELQFFANYRQEFEQLITSIEFSEVWFKRQYIYEINNFSLFTNIPDVKFLEGDAIFLEPFSFEIYLESTTRKDYRVELNNLLIGVNIKTINGKYDRLFLIDSILLSTNLINLKFIKSRIVFYEPITLTNYIRDKKFVSTRTSYFRPISLFINPPNWLQFALPDDLRCWLTQQRFISIYEFYGVFAKLLSFYFDSQQRVRVSNPWSTDYTTGSTIQVEIWPGRPLYLSGNLPRVYVGRGPIAQQRIGLGNLVQTETALDSPTYVTNLVGEIFINVINYEYNATLMLAYEIANFLQYYRSVLNKYFGFMYLFAPEIKEIRPAKEFGGQDNVYLCKITFKFIYTITEQITVD